MSTGLMASDLQDSTDKGLHGIRRHNLTGLLDADVLHMMEHYGIRGQAKTLKEYAKLIDNHSLLVGMLAGRIHDDAGGDFARWMEEHGRALALHAGNLAEPPHNILQYPLNPLPPNQPKLFTPLPALPTPPQ